MGDYVKSGIVMLKRSQLHPHPDNPRKDLGDSEDMGFVHYELEAVAV